MENIRSTVVDPIDNYLATSGLSARRFGILSVGSKHFIRRLRIGTSIQLGAVEKAIQWMADHPPSELTGD